MAARPPKPKAHPPARLSKVDVDTLVAQLRKKYGDKIGAVGKKLPPVPRCPFGILPLDIATGGGFPLTRLTVLYGPDACGKTTHALKAVAEYQKRWPDKRCIYVDVEGTLDTDWAAKVGVDTDALVPLKPEFAEQAVDVVEQMMYADNVGLLVWDSIAATAGQRELDSSAEKADPGGISRAINSLVRRTTLALSEGGMAGRLPTMIWINQIRMQVGVKFGNPETLPGGNAQRYMACLRIRLTGYDKMDGEVNKDIPSVKETTAMIEKWKQTIVRRRETYDVVVIPHNGLAVGQTSDWRAIRGWLLDLGHLAKVKGGYTCLGEEFKTQALAWAWLKNEPARLDALIQEIIHHHEDSRLNTDPAIIGSEQ